MTLITTTYLRHMGSDLDVVNNARVSFLKTSQLDELTGELKEDDKRLIRFLARGMPETEFNVIVAELTANGYLRESEVVEALWSFRNTPTHWAPFANGNNITFHVRAPIPIMRQVFKHKIGAVESEISRRYVDEEPEFFFPKWREKAPNVKQGSGGLHNGTIWYEDSGFAGHSSLDSLYDMHIQASLNLYNSMIKGGVCAEQARFVLPQSMMTEAIVSHSLYGWANFFNQRTDPHAQQEIRDLAEQLGQQIEPLFPVSWPALTKANEAYEKESKE